MLWLTLSALPAAADVDFPVSRGYFFAELQGPLGRGYAVVDDNNAPMWSCLQELGGTALMGRPISSRYSENIINQNHPGQRAGKPILRQAFANAIVEWAANPKSCRLVPLIPDFPDDSQERYWPIYAADGLSLNDEAGQGFPDLPRSIFDPAGVSQHQDTAPAQHLISDLPVFSEQSESNYGWPLLDSTSISARGLVKTHHSIPREATLPKPPPLPKRPPVASPRVVLTDQSEHLHATYAVLTGANRAAILLVPRYRLPGPPEVIIRPVSDLAVFVREALKLPEISVADVVLANRRCGIKSRNFRTGSYTLLILTSCHPNGAASDLIQRHTAQWYAMIIHQAIGPHWSTLPIWFLEGLAWHEAAESLGETDPARETGPFSLDMLTSTEQWQDLSPTAWETAHQLAIDAVGQLRSQFGPLAPGTILHWARSIGFDRAFTEVTGLTVGDFSGADPQSTHNTLYSSNDQSVLDP